ncbi:hypothetical protein [Nocardioides sp.]|uniref:hypothetical protein n=1 Tax=Nocardioides sp. TaxID=35761 RepID=UPI002727DBE1|nr:hypothetical protein [Nocardioides sp.]MDO9455110.1 hypothetical protein [Nocardioides sp.]
MTTTAPRHLRRPRTLLAAAAVAALLLTGCGDTTEAGPDGPDADRADRAGATVAPTPTSSAASPSDSPVDDGSTPDVPVDPAQVTAVPDDFPLAAGLPATNGDDGSPVTVTDRPSWRDVELCGDVVWSQQVPVPTLDRAGASYTGEAEDTRSRLVAVYADELDAQQALDTLRDAYAACPSQDLGGTEQVYQVVDTAQGSATVTHRYRLDGRFDAGLEVIELVAVGNALYLSSYYGEGGGSDEAIASFVDFARESSQPVLDALAVFSDLGGPTSTTPPADGEILDDFPLASGWPTRTVEPGSAGLELPVDGLLASFPDYACDSRGPAAGTTDVLRAQYSDVEAYLSRELLTFADADDAVAHLAALRDFYGSCPTPTEDGLSYPLRLVDTEVGGDSFAVVRSTEYDGEPAIGMSALHAVRVGRSILLDSTSGEGIVQDAGDAEDLAASMATRAADVVAAQCAFTVAGC